jgi:dimethylargininase
MIAFTRVVPRSIVDCELTHLAREPIDWSRANAQHEEYERVLRTLGCSVRRLPALPHHPDSVFVEDTAVVFDECAVITRPGAASRRGEVDSVAEALGALRTMHQIETPGTLDGGDVLRVGRHVYVGLSSRSDADGARQLADAIAQFGYAVRTVAVRDCLHLKSAASSLPDGRVLIDAGKIDRGVFAGAECIDVESDEPAGANVLTVGDTVLCPAAAPRTRDRLAAAGYTTMVVDASELTKAEGALTCCSLLLGD